jgi:rod shape determining protein RodA
MALLSSHRSSKAGIWRTFSHIDGWLVLSVGLLLMMGLMSLYSIDAATHSTYFKKQLLRLAIGIGPFLILLLVKLDRWRRWAPFLYVFSIGLLGVVLAVGDKRNEAQRWIQIGPLDFQPSELAKILVVLTLGTFLANRIDQIRTLKTFVLSFVHVAIPMALIYKQPHLGSTLVVGATWLAMVWIGGARMRHIIGAIVIGMGLLTTAYFTPGMMSAYQKERIHGLVDPDIKGSGYQVHRGLVAIGSGGIGGKGFLRGEQKSLRFIPEQQTDFVVTVLGEEGGLLGCVAMLAAFGLLFFRTWSIVYQSVDPFIKMAAAGVFAILAFHTVANLGMVLRLLPVVGLWLPFMSYGGTALWLCMACVGLLLNLRAQESIPEF